MSSPKAPAVQAVIPLTDPLNVQEAYATEVIVNIRDAIVHMTFIAVRPKGVDTNGQPLEERVVTGRVVTSTKAADAISNCLRQAITATQAPTSGTVN